MGNGASHGEVGSLGASQEGLQSFSAAVHMDTIGMSKDVTVDQNYLAGVDGMAWKGESLLKTSQESTLIQCKDEPQKEGQPTVFGYYEIDLKVWDQIKGIIGEDQRKVMCAKLKREISEIANRKMKPNGAGHVVPA